MRLDSYTSPAYIRVRLVCSGNTRFFGFYSRQACIRDRLVFATGFYTRHYGYMKIRTPCWYYSWEIQVKQSRCKGATLTQTIQNWYLLGHSTRNANTRLHSIMRRADKTSHIADKTSHIADKTSHIADKTSHIADKTSHIFGGIPRRLCHLPPRRLCRWLALG